MPYRVWLLRLLFLFLTVSMSPAQTPQKPPSKPNIVLITIDTTRADRMGFLGSNRGITPHLDAVAKQGYVFSRAYSQVPLTVPSHASLLTGTYPQFNHINDFGGAIAKDLPYLPDQLHQNGYRTAAFVASLVLDPKSGLAPGMDRGFDSYDAGFRTKHDYENRYETVERRAEDVVGHAIAWLKKRPEGPFFIWVHLYDAEIAYADNMLGQLFAELQTDGLYEKSLIAVMSDHGEAFGEHGEVLHGIFLYDETVHVPLLIKLPAAAASSAATAAPIDARVGLVDVAPTILEVAGISVPAAMQGHSLLPLIQTPTAHGPEHSVYSETDYPHLAFGWSSLRSWRAGKYVYIEAPRRELYDETLDSKEAKNLAQSSPAIADTLQGQLEAFRTSTASGSAGLSRVDPEMAHKLAALGYASGGGGTNGEGKVEGADPKDRIEIADLFH